MNAKNLLICAISFIAGFYSILYAMNEQEKFADLRYKALYDCFERYGVEDAEENAKKEFNALLEFEQKEKKARAGNSAGRLPGIHGYCPGPVDFSYITPLIRCQRCEAKPSFIITSCKFVNETLLGSSSFEELKKALWVLMLRKKSSLKTYNCKFGVNTKPIQIPENMNILFEEKYLDDIHHDHDEYDNFLCNTACKIDNNNTINYTVKVDSAVFRKATDKNSSFFLERAHDIANATHEKGVVRNFFIGTLGFAGLLLPYCKDILPYCGDKNNASLAAAGFLTTILAANYLKKYFEGKDIKIYISRTQKLRNEQGLSDDRKYFFYQEFTYGDSSYLGKKNEVSHNLYIDRAVPKESERSFGKNEVIASFE